MPCESRGTVNSNLVCLSFVDKHSQQPVSSATVSAEYQLFSTPTEPFAQTPWIPRMEYEMDMENTEVVYFWDRTSGILVERESGEVAVVVDIQIPIRDGR